MAHPPRGKFWHMRSQTFTPIQLIPQEEYSYEVIMAGLFVHRQLMINE